MNAREIFAIEAEDFSLDELPADTPLPPAVVTWPDGRVDELPQFDEESGIDMEDLIEDRLYLRFSFTNDMAAFPGIDTADLVRLSDDVWYRRISTDFGIDRHYLRGEFKSIFKHWLDHMVGAIVFAETPLDALILCTHLGLLADLESASDGEFYEASLFSMSPIEGLIGEAIRYSYSLSITDIATVTEALEAAGCTWPRRAASGDPETLAAWQQRVRESTEGPSAI
jgi:hypothetical protein